MAAGRLEFRILGPLAVHVDGRPLAIGGPKQRALLALLLLSANRVVSRERLAAELFPGQEVEAADHALRNHVSRLRKALATGAADEPRLVARAPGYLLRVEPGELDLDDFGRRAAAARDALARGETERAASAFRSAERLWHGRPLADLEFEPFSRLEVERLEELRLAVVEERVDVELAFGRQRALIPELEALAEEHPYRERFRAQLMLALYRSGRQAEGLEVYRRTRTLLDDELGLEPGVELRQLERAILVHDPALETVDAARTRPPAQPDICPFKGLAPFEAADAELFFGRERLVDELAARLGEAPLLAIVGPSGSGKSSLLRAGLVPALARAAVVVRPGTRPAAELAAALADLAPDERAVLAVDQLEELFAPEVDEADRRSFVDALVETAWDPGRRLLVVLALRADFFGRLAAYPGLADLVAANHVLLGPMSGGELRRAIEGPAAKAGLEVEPALVDALVDDVAGEPGGLPLLSSALVELWDEREGRLLTLAAYERSGGVRGVVARQAEAAFRSLEEQDRATARRVLLRLVAGGDGEAPTRTRAPISELEEEDVRRVLEALVEHRLVVLDAGSVELVHEALLTQWPRLAEWVEEDAEGRHLRRRLVAAARDWEGSGRDGSELYRGARLAAALDWAEAAGDDAALSRSEQEFLRESRIASARSSRRLRVLLAVALVLLAAAVAGGVVALVARGTASREATAAIAQRLGAQALADPQLDRSLLLAREGVALDDSAATRSNLLAAALRSPAALAVLHATGARVLDAALDPAGRTLVVRGDDGTTSFFDARTGVRRGSPVATSDQIGYFGAVALPFRALAFSPDGQTLAVGDSDGWHATLELLDARTHRLRTGVTDRRAAVTADVLFAPDGRTVIAGEPVTGRHSPPAEVLAVYRASDGAALRRSRRVAGGRLIGWARHGHSLLETTADGASYLLDPRTLRPVRTFPIAGAAALAPGGDVAAFGRDDGTVTLLDLRTGALRATERRAPGSVLALAFGAGGRMLATGSDEGTIAVWDVASRTLRETFEGHAGAIRSLLFSRDGRTLYSSSNDGSAIVWDVSGLRRLVARFRFAPPSVAPDAASAVAVSPDGARFVTSPGPGRVTLRRTRDLATVRGLRGPTGPIESLAFSRDGRLVAATGDSRWTAVWDGDSGRLVARLGPSGKGGASAVAFSPDGRLVATAGIDGKVLLYDLRTGSATVGPRSARFTFQDVDFSADGTRLVAVDLKGEVWIWNVQEDRLERLIRQHQGLLTVRFSPDGNRVATGDLGGTIRVWDVQHGRLVGRPIGGLNGPAVSVSFDPQGKHLFTTSGDGKLRLWDLATSKLVGAPLPGAETAGWGTFFPGGRRAIAAFGDGTAVLWNLDPRAWTAAACRVAHRSLTRDEWRDFLPERRFRRSCP